MMNERTNKKKGEKKINSEILLIKKWLLFFGRHYDGWHRDARRTVDADVPPTAAEPAVPPEARHHEVEVEGIEQLRVEDSGGELEERAADQCEQRQALTS